MIYGMHRKYDYADQFADLGTVVRRSVRTLKPFLDSFDFIAVQGMSGVLVGSPVSIALKKPLVIVRKDEDYLGSSHSSNRIENVQQAHEGRYLFLDDFIKSGSTKRRVATELLRFDSVEAAFYEYGPDHYSPADGDPSDPSPEYHRHKREMRNTENA